MSGLTEDAFGAFLSCISSGIHLYSHLQSEQRHRTVEQDYPALELRAVGWIGKKTGVGGGAASSNLPRRGSAKQQAVQVFTSGRRTHIQLVLQLPPRGTPMPSPAFLKPANFNNDEICHQPNACYHKN